MNAAATRLRPGDPAPDFTLPDQHGHPTSLAERRGRRTVLYFYPEAMTPACTGQACDFRDGLAGLAAAGIDVLGVSRDPVERLARFDERDGLGFPLLSDPDRVVHLAYGVWGEKQLYGKTVVGVIRSTFIIGADGRIEDAIYNTRAKGHVAMLRKRLGLDG